MGVVSAPRIETTIDFALFNNIPFPYSIIPHRSCILTTSLDCNPCLPSFHFAYVYDWDTFWKAIKDAPTLFQEINSAEDIENAVKNLTDNISNCMESSKFHKIYGNLQKCSSETRSITRERNRIRWLTTKVSAATSHHEYTKWRNHERNYQF